MKGGSFLCSASMKIHDDREQIVLGVYTWCYSRKRNILAVAELDKVMDMSGFMSFVEIWWASRIGSELRQNLSTG